MILLKTISFI